MSRQNAEEKRVFKRPRLVATSPNAGNKMEGAAEKGSEFHGSLVSMPVNPR
jgi:hypothetical protein